MNYKSFIFSKFKRAYSMSILYREYSMYIYIQSNFNGSNIFGTMKILFEIRVVRATEA